MGCWAMLTRITFRFTEVSWLKYWQGNRAKMFVALFHGNACSLDKMKTNVDGHF